MVKAILKYVAIMGFAFVVALWVALVTVASLITLGVIPP